MTASLEPQACGPCLYRVTVLSLSRRTSFLLIAVVATCLVAWVASCMTAMPGRSHVGALPELDEDGRELAQRLRGHVERLATEIGERNVRRRPKALIAAARFIEDEWSAAGLQVSREPVIADGVETIDASDVDTSLLNAIGLGHSYFAEQPTVIDDLRLLLDGRDPPGRGLAGHRAGGRDYWEIVP